MNRILGTLVAQLNRHKKSRRKLIAKKGEESTSASFITGPRTTGIPFIYASEKQIVHQAAILSFRMLTAGPRMSTKRQSHFLKK
jgi:hypothetical protein